MRCKKATLSKAENNVSLWIKMWLFTKQFDKMTIGGKHENGHRF